MMHNIRTASGMQCSRLTDFRAPFKMVFFAFPALFILIILSIAASMAGALELDEEELMKVLHGVDTFGQSGPLSSIHMHSSSMRFAALEDTRFGKILNPPRRRPVHSQHNNQDRYDFDLRSNIRDRRPITVPSGGDEDDEEPEDDIPYEPIRDPEQVGVGLYLLNLAEENMATGTVYADFLLYFLKNPNPTSPSGDNATDALEGLVCENITRSHANNERYRPTLVNTGFRPILFNLTNSYRVQVGVNDVPSPSWTIPLIIIIILIRPYRGPSSSM